MSRADGDADVAAMQRLRDGDDLALNLIMDRWGGPVFRFLARHVGDDGEAEDLTQETFVAVYRARLSYRPAARFSTWLFAIATNLARQRTRWRRRHPEAAVAASPGEPVGAAATLASAGADPRQQTLAKERDAAVRDAVLELPVDLREVVLLAEYEDLSQAEIAAIVGCSVKAVESRLYRARAQLRERLRAWL